MTHPIAKAIAERMRPYTAVYDLVSDVEAGVFDDLLNPPDGWWRMVAVMRERLRAGESVASVAADYNTPEDVVAMLVDRPWLPANPPYDRVDTLVDNHIRAHAIPKRSMLSDDLIDEMYDGMLADVWEHGSGGILKDKLSEVYEWLASQGGELAELNRRYAAELRAWEAKRER